MTIFSPKEYQTNAISEITDAIGTGLSLDGSEQRIIVFKAPTGSGKTVMLAHAIDLAFQRNAGRKFITLWLTPGKGRLDEQSWTRLSEVLVNSSNEVSLLTPSYLASHEAVRPGTILVSNWESLVQWDSKNSDWKNHLTRDGEQRNLFHFLNACAAQGTDLLLVFDESHTHVSGGRSRELLNIVREIIPYIEIHASATPKNFLSNDVERRLSRMKRFHYIEVMFDHVVKAGMVKKIVEFNSGLDLVKMKHPLLNSEQLALQAAWEKHSNLTLSYSDVGSQVNPLLLVQVPDSDEGEQRMEATINYFNGIGLVEGEDLAIWTANKKTENLSNITILKSNVKVLLFKQAIVTGWDCTRAHILVQFRETNSTTFAIQTLGRILRMPELHHYNDESLNTAYVFSDLPEENITITSEDEPDRIIVDTTLVLRDELYGDGVQLKSLWAPRQRDFDYVSHSISTYLIPLLDKTFGGLPTTPEDSYGENVQFNLSVDTEIIASPQNEIEITGETISLDSSEERILAIFNHLIVSDIRPYPHSARRDSRSRIKTVIHEWFRNRYPNYSAFNIALACVANQSALTEVIHEACETLAITESLKAKEKAKNERTLIERWELPSPPFSRVSSSASITAGGSFVYNPPLARQTDSEEEKEFEGWLISNISVIKWWWRNGSRDATNLGIAYPDKLGPDGVFDANITYPDYIFMTSIGVLYVVEIKPLGDRDGDYGGITHRKGVGLSNWAKEMNSRVNCPEKLPTVNVAIVIPHRSGTETVFKEANIGDWQHPSRENLATNHGWFTFKI